MILKRSALAVVVLWLLSVRAVPVFAQSAGTANQLIRESEFIGFVKAAPEVAAPNSSWKQRVFVYTMDALKGHLDPIPGTKQNPWLYADNAAPANYSSWFAEKGEYLVFLRSAVVRQMEVWTVIAVFPVNYHPDKTGQVVGTVAGDGSRQTGNDATRTLEVSLLRRLLQQALSNKMDAAFALRALNNFFPTGTVLSSQARAIPTFEERFQQAQQLVATIRPGTTRADIEKVFPQEDGGASGPDNTRYYLGSEVMVNVPYDQTGGNWKPQNKVRGPLKVYRSMMSYD